MPSSAWVEITGTGRRVAAVLWKSRSYSMSQMMSRTRPTRTVAIQANKAAVLITILSLHAQDTSTTLRAQSGDRAISPYLRLRPENGLNGLRQHGAGRG